MHRKFNWAWVQKYELGPNSKPNFNKWGGGECCDGGATKKNTLDFYPFPVLAQINNKKKEGRGVCAKFRGCTQRRFD